MQSTEVANHERCKEVCRLLCEVAGILEYALHEIVALLDNIPASKRPLEFFSPLTIRALSWYGPSYVKSGSLLLDFSSSLYSFFSVSFVLVPLSGCCIVSLWPRLRRLEPRAPQSDRLRTPWWPN